MHGSLNAARIALVATAVVAAILAAVVGKWVVTVVLLAAVVIHGFGWVYLSRQRNDEPGP